jgi:hypothetical protein
MNEPIPASTDDSTSPSRSLPMRPLEAVEQAIAQMGTATAEDLTHFIQEHFGVRVQPRFVPIIREMLKDRERRAEALRTRASIEADAASIPDAS